MIIGGGGGDLRTHARKHTRKQASNRCGIDCSREKNPEAEFLSSIVSVFPSDFHGSSRNPVGYAEGKTRVYVAAALGIADKAEE